MARGRIEINEDRCKGCALCTVACPHGLIALASGRVSARGYTPATLLDPGHKCTGCALCAVACPDVCITVYRSITASQAALTA